MLPYVVFGYDPSEASSALPGRVRLPLQPPPHADGGVSDTAGNRLQGRDRDIQHVVCFGVKWISIIHY